MKFGSYNGWVNKPTWSAYTVLTSYDESREDLEALMMQAQSDDEAMEAFQNWLQKALESWFSGKRFRYAEAMDIFMKDQLGDSVYAINWPLVVDALQLGKKDILVNQEDDLNAVAYDVFQSIDWQSVIGEQETKVNADEALRTFLLDRVYDWIEKPRFRTTQGPLREYVRTAFNIWVKAIHIGDVVKALREE